MAKTEFNFSITWDNNLRTWLCSRTSNSAFVHWTCYNLPAASHIKWYNGHYETAWYFYSQSLITGFPLESGV